MATVRKTLGDIEPQPPLIGDGHDYGTISDTIADCVDRRRTPRAWFVTFLIAGLILIMFLNVVGYLLVKGVGIWGINIPVGWGFAIINFVWWIGIGHAGTLISAILLLLHQQWRTSINRFAEAMTLFAVACAGMFPLLHLGRPWLFYFIMPYPSTTGYWPQFKSPLVWDVFAISTYGTVSLIFWYVGLVPDLATMRDRAKNRVVKLLYAIPALGWRGSARHWHRYEMAYLLLAGLSAPLVVSVHSIVSLDFSVGIIPGWHTTVFPPYFVAGAIYSGFAMVLTLMIPVRKIYHLESLVTSRHLDNMAKVMLATGLIVAYGYASELFFGWYSGNEFEQALVLNRVYGAHSGSYYALILCNILIPQLLWLRWVRLNVYVLWIITIVINIGMWLERYVIVVNSLERDFLPSSWDEFVPTIWDWLTYLGTIGLFIFLLMLFIRFVPMLAIAEIQALHHENKHASSPKREEHS